jgi:putative ABC transport system permease protein
VGRLAILKIAFASLAAHKLRTALTTLGIIFGVAAVVSMLSIGEGAKEEALEQIRLLGTNTLLVRAAEPPEGRGEKQESSRTEGLNRGDLRNILRLDGVVEAAAPQRREAIKRAFYADREAKVDVLATTPDFLHVSGAEIGEGRFLSHADDAEARRVCVLGYAVRRELFPFESPLGKTIKMGRDYFSVVGVMANRPIGKSRIEGLKIDDLNRQVYVPLGSAEQRIERGRQATGRMTVMGMGSFSFGGENALVPPLDEISVRITREDWVASASRVIERMLLRRHRGVRDFEVTVPDELLRQSQRTQRIFNIVMGAIAGISLVVGGIGIMNIMLATVLERTHEIGVRRAVGARRSDILTQFMSEAVAISLLGSIAGVALGFGMAKGIAHYAQWRTIVSIDSILLAVGVAAGVGLLFGIYPARQAAMLDPIEAVRYE